MEAAAVGFEVIANFGFFGKADVAVDDGAADARVAADVDVIIEDGFRDFAIAIDADIVADDAILHAATGEDRAAGDDGINGNAHAAGIGKYEFCRGILVLPAAERPMLVVEVEDRRNADEVHVGFVVGVEGADVAPIESFLAVFVDEVVGIDAMLGDDAGKNVFAEIMSRPGILGIGEKDGDKELGIENIDAHGGVAMGGLVSGLLGLGGFFLKTDNAPVLIGFDDTELLGGLSEGNFDGGDGDIGGGVDVLLEHSGVVHFVDLVAGKDEDELGALAADGVDILINGVRGALVPLLRDAHLRGKHFDEFAEAHQRRPTGANVAIKTEGLVLSKDKNAAERRVDAIREGDIDDAVKSAEGDSRLGAISGERPETFTLSTREENSEGIAHIRHEDRLPRQDSEAV